MQADSIPRARLTRRATTRLAVLCGGLALGVAGNAFATTATVFGPDISADDRSFEYRLTVFPGEDGGPDRRRQRLHYQHAFSDRLRGRILGAWDGTDGFPDDHALTRVEVQWQYHLPEGSNRAAALRFDFQDGAHSPDRLRIAWTGRIDLDSGWQLRANALAGRQLGDEAASGVLLEARAQATYPIGERLRLGVDLFSFFNSTADSGNFDDQLHQLGPVVRWRPAADWSLTAGFLAGISASAPDENWYLHLGRAVGRR